VQKHVAVLERAGLIQKRANGREQLVSTNHARLRRAGELLEYFEAIWRQRMAQLDDVLLPKGHPPGPPASPNSITQTTRPSNNKTPRSTS
jgi:hypothetical protein